jgi:hypothetical protein
LQALERSFLSNDWLTLVLVMLTLVVFFLRVLNQEKLQGYFLGLFNKGFIDAEVEERMTMFNAFYILQFLYSVLIIALGIFTIANHYQTFTNPLNSFLWISAGALVYFVLKKALEYGISFVLQIQEGVKFYLISKSTYLYSLSYFIFAFIVLFFYADLPINSLFFFFAFGFLFRLILMITYNKNLIFNHLFYFILYICGFEIAPLLILFKLML